MMYHITCNTDDKYVQHCMAMLCSLFKNNIKYNFALHILEHGLSGYNKSELTRLSLEYKNEIYFHQVDENVLNGVQFRKKRPLTKAAYYRLLLSSILPNVDMVLYLDCDMIVLGDVSELFNLDLSNYAVAACLDPMPFNDLHRRQLNIPVGNPCFCSGIMLVNLKYWREHDAENKLLSFARKKREPVFLHDQDVLNHVFTGVWYLLPPKWNRPSFLSFSKNDDFKGFDYVEMYKHPCVIHYNNQTAKPWFNVYSPLRDYYLLYLKKSKYNKIVFQNISLKSKLSIWRASFHCFYSESIEPFLPQLIVILIGDIKLLFKIFMICLKGIYKNREWTRENREQLLKQLYNNKTH